MAQTTLSQFFRESLLLGVAVDLTRDKGLPRRDLEQHGAESPKAAAGEGIELLRSLLEIPSLSGQEAAASAFLVDWMAQRGLHSFVDAAGNAVGILDGGPAADGSPPQDIVLLGHIDTVGGDVPVGIEDGKLYGRGAVDAKGPLAAFAVAAAQLGPQPGWRIAVVGAVEEEAATSKGARYAAAQYRPAFCIIGEPSGWDRVTLGYKGRLLAYATVQRPAAHTARAEASVCELAVDFWNRVRARVAQINAGREKLWDQVLPSLRSFNSGGDGLQESAAMMLGFRLPPDLGPDALAVELRALAQGVDLRFDGAEHAFQGDKNNALVRAFLAAIRSQGQQPGFVLKTGTSDMNVVGPIWQCPIVAYGPGDSSLDHTPNEHVVIAEWQHAVAVLAQVLQRLSDGPAAAGWNQIDRSKKRAYTST
jgi:LysW-gamma-L-lysine carboxypeptidase